MLQIIFATVLLLLPASSFAQIYQPGGDVPAFLRNEARQNQAYQSPQQMQQQPVVYSQPVDPNVPAFLQKETEEQRLYRQQMMQLQQQNQYNYQSADPNSGSYTLAPAVYQPAQGDTPAFLLQQGQPQPVEEKTTFKAKKASEDTIQINFSEDQYKAEEEVTTLNKDEVKEYNAEVKNNVEEASVNEIPEGAKFEGTKEGAAVKTEEGAVAATTQGQAEAQKQTTEKEKQITAQAVPEPEKSKTNILRINYSQEVTELSEKDKASLLNVVKTLRSNKSQKVLLVANTSERDVGVSADKIGLMRVIGIRDYLMKQGVDFSQTEVKIENSELNKENLDYIDIDKI